MDTQRLKKRIAITVLFALAVIPVNSQVHKTNRPTGLPPGAAMVWQDRGDLTPSIVFWGAASAYPNPQSRLPKPPFSHFERDTTANSRSPKAKLRDASGVEWTVKLGVEARPDVAAPRLAWALGFGAVEGYEVEAGRIEGVTPATDLGEAKGAIQPDGSFAGGARFKRHDKQDSPVKAARGQDMNWSEDKNPGVPPEHLSGLMIFDALVSNWDAQKKNCKVYHVANGPHGPENWYIVSDMGASFADKPKNKFVLADYQKQPPLVKAVANDYVELNFADASPQEGAAHRRIPLAHAQWFRKVLARLTDDEIRAAFDAAYATPALNDAYASGSADKIAAARQKEIAPDDRAQIDAYVRAVRVRIDDFMQKVPAG